MSLLAPGPSQRSWCTATRYRTQLGHCTLDIFGNWYPWYCLRQQGGATRLLSGFSISELPSRAASPRTPWAGASLQTRLLQSGGQWAVGTLAASPGQSCDFSKQSGVAGGQAGGGDWVLFWFLRCTPRPPVLGISVGDRSHRCRSPDLTPGSSCEGVRAGDPVLRE